MPIILSLHITATLHDNTKLALVGRPRTRDTITCDPRRRCSWMTPRVKHEEVNSSHVREMRVANNGGGCAARESKGGQKANERRRSAHTNHRPAGCLYLLTHFKCSPQRLLEFKPLFNFRPTLLKSRFFCIPMLYWILCWPLESKWTYKIKKINQHHFNYYCWFYL